jgi:hypothetical protein
MSRNAAFLHLGEKNDLQIEERKPQGVSQRRLFLSFLCLLLAYGGVGVAYLWKSKGGSSSGSPLSTVGVVNREEIIKEAAQRFSKENLEGRALDLKLSEFLESYERVLNDVMGEKKILLFERGAFATTKAPDYTREVKERLNSLSFKGGR